MTITINGQTPTPDQIQSFNDVFKVPTLTVMNFAVGAALTAKTAAEAARDSVNTTGKVYTAAEGTATGIAGTTNGQQFAVLSADLLSYGIWRNNAGTALYLSGVKTDAYLDAVLPQWPASSAGIMPFVQDVDGRILSGMYMNGDPFPAVNDLVAAVRLAALESQFVAVPFSSDGIMPFIQDVDGRILIGMYPDGSAFPASTASFDTILPSDDRLLVSDYQTIGERSSSRLRFVRTITDVNNYQNCSPGSRVTFDTTATDLKLTFYYNNLVTRLHDRNFIGCVLVAGAVVKTFTSPLGDAGACTVEVPVSLGASALRTVTILWPYADGMDLVNVRYRGGNITAPTARPTAKLVTAGDSITQGFLAGNISTTWAYLLSALENRQLINLGYGGRQAVASDGLGLSGTGANAVTYMIGYNDFFAQTPLATFQTAVQGYLTNARASLPAAKLYIVTPIYSPNTNTNTLADYRTRIANAVTAVGDANTVLVNGLSIMTNSNDRFGDGSIHPNDLGSSEIATALAAIIT